MLKMSIDLYDLGVPPWIGVCRCLFYVGHLHIWIIIHVEYSMNTHDDNHYMEGIIYV